MDIRIYTAEYKKKWDAFVRSSKNGTFLFCRDFMEYHSHRFPDHSFLFYTKNKLIAVMPGHISEKIFYSHQGLTYGGLIMSEEITSTDVLTIFEHLTVTLRNQGIKKMIYKAVPHIYHKAPSEEDLYVLFRYKASLSTRSISSTIFYSNGIKYDKRRTRGLKKALNNGLTVIKSNDLALFWKILSNNLEEKYSTQPVHSLSEISYLKEKFPNEIHLFLAFDRNDVPVSGCLIFEMEYIVHVQYIAATKDGKKHGAVDLVIDHIVNTYSHKTYFDYGISTENNGLYLNENLIHQKEGFGARGIVYDTYTIDL
ncbi:GNAT family N-acetyltransferase [Dysgonomonas sp. Marseille-P4677]|uniref:GNAT family N-acetyltransferase n=1 Tax=Dysgonomonas sp. Marseille-P4677 TaxID=2364790 RepID=UPI0019139E75|nr:GNAT family N-acetyltransferase [Dysgonomonas sp. Marseille-P4677]MBK5720603.1 GNAT family N-acetyltransferase [Dysgonomonas sp. Marseille-P4677]